MRPCANHEESHVDNDEEAFAWDTAGVEPASAATSPEQPRSASDVIIPIRPLLGVAEVGEGSELASPGAVVCLRGNHPLLVAPAKARRASPAQSHGVGEPNLQAQIAQSTSN